MRTTLIVISALLLFACRKSGTGGSTDVAAFVAHHGKPIKGATVYMKFGAKDAPSDPTSQYDLKVNAEPNEDHAHFHGLLPGNYFLYAVGYDSSIAQPVKGGVPLTIKRKDKHRELDVNVAVSE